MVTNVLEYLEAAEEKYPSRCAYRDIQNTYTFSEAGRIARAIGSKIAGLNAKGRPVAVMMEKSASMILAFLGVVYGGCCYCPIDVKMPRERIQVILTVLKPEAVITEPAVSELAEQLAVSCPVYRFEELARGDILPERLDAVRRRTVDTDPLYVLFTSGSTGIPKGVVMNHKVILNNMEWLAQEFAFSCTDVMGNQVPLHFDVANHDIYCPLKFGCSTFIIPPEYFTFPAKLVECLNQYRVTGIFWVPFALCVAADLEAFTAGLPDYLRYVFFAGEVMPVKQLNYWRRHLPDVQYVNMYGSTETHVCTYYRLEREFEDDEKLPIGRPCGNVDILVLDDENRLVLPGSDTVGELCIRGSGFALGYLANQELNQERFVWNPLNTRYPERIYRTGDLVSYDRQGELCYHSRRDFQIKRLGYRIELGEIEAAAGGIAEIERCACLYDPKKQTILFLYTGRTLERKGLVQCLSRKIPKYMMPGRYIHLEEMPLNGNGKIDRRRLKELYV